MPACPACGTDNPIHAKFCLECGRRLVAAAGAETRRIVTVLFSDIVGSTALGESLDPEALRVVLSSYFALMERILDRHGGSVEKFIGDAIMAVFGLRAIHEDDALRAVRAALEMREALAALNVELAAERGVAIATRTGIHTGEVVAGDPSARQTLVTGDAVNTAARLEQAAGSGEILIGDPTWRLVRDRVDATPIAPVGAKGKAGPVPALRLIGLRPEPTAAIAPGAGPFVGRDRELQALRATFDRVVAERRSAVVTVLGAAGVGKSRLVRELLAEVRERGRILRGRCLSYGDGVTYWPLREILAEAAGIRDDDRPGEAVRKLERLLDGAPEGSLVAERLAGAVGLSTEPARREEIFWAVRRMLAHLAERGPLVVVVDDIHWAEPTLLDLLEETLTRLEPVPLLVVCTAREDLVDRRPDWPAGSPGAVAIDLEGLGTDAASALLDALPGGASIPPALRERILASADGNPLFVEEMVGMLVDEGVLAADGSTPPAAVAAEQVAVPPTVRALMAARVDGLPPSERSTAQRASVVGRAFEASEVVELTPLDERPGVATALLQLLRRDLLTREGAGLSVADAYRFRHVLIRDAAYEALRKSERAELHERFAHWLEGTASDRLAELEEIVGYHLAEAHRYRSELREGGPRTEAIGRRAAAHLRIAARHARERGDSAAAISLGRRVEALPPLEDGEQAAFLIDHGRALLDVGRAADAGARAAEALRLAEAVGDRRLAAHARLLALDVAQADGSLVTFDAALAAGQDAALRDAEASGDPAAQADAWLAISTRSWAEARIDDSTDELRTALAFARAAADRRLEVEIELNLLVTTFAGPSPAGAVIEAALDLAQRSAAYPTIRAEARTVLAVSEAMLERFDAAIAHVDESLATLDDHAQLGSLVNARTYRAWIHRLAGDLPAAEDVLRQALREATEIGDRSLESFVSCRLAEVLVNQGRYDEAEAPLAVAERQSHGATDTRIAGAHARIRAARGDREGALADVERMLAMVEGTPWLNVRTEALIDAAHATLTLGSLDRARAHAVEALRLCEAKDDIALAVHVRALLERTDAPGAASA